MSTKKLIKALGLIIVVALLAAALPLQAKAQAATVVATETELRDALANPDVTEITITADISVGSVAGNVFIVSSGRTVTLDLNGHTISADTSNGGVFMNTGTLIIVDNSDNHGGKIINTNTTQTTTGDAAKSAISNYGVLTVNSGVTVAGPANGHGSWGSPNFNPAYGIDNLGGGQVTVNGATISGAYGLRNFANVNGTSITINGGIITGKTGIAMQSFGTNIGTLTINGDTSVTANPGSAIFASGVTQYNHIVINGGTFSGVSDDGALCVVDGTVEINGGTFTGNNDTYSLNNYYAIVDVTAGTFNGDIWGGESEPYTGYEGTGLTSFAPSEGKCITVVGEIEGAVVGSNLVNACHVHNVTQDTYFHTIQAAIDAASDGDTILVSPGEYAEYVELRKPNITVRSTDGAAATKIVTPPGTLTTGVKVLANMGVVTFDGFTVKNFTESGIIQGMAASEGTTFHVLNNIVEPYADYLRNGIQVSGDGSTVIGNTVYGKRLTEDWASTGITVVDASNVIVKNNTIIGGETGVDNGIGLIAYNNTISNITVEGNTISDAFDGVNLQGNYWDDTRFSINNVSIKSNVISDSSEGIGAYWLTDLTDLVVDKNQFNNLEYGGLWIDDSVVGTVSGVDASPNWWGSLAGPDQLSTDVDVYIRGETIDQTVYVPWCGDAECSFLVHPMVEGGLQASINATPVGEALYVPDLGSGVDYTGSFTVGGKRLILGDGVVIQASSPCFTVTDSYTTITAESNGGAKCVLSDTYGIEVNANLKNIIIEGIYFDTDNVGEGPGVIHFDGGIEDVIINDNYFRAYASIVYDGIVFDVPPAGYVEIKGNFFEMAGILGCAVNNFYGTSTIDARFNSFGGMAGHPESVPDVRVCEHVDYSNFTHADVYLETSETPWLNQQKVGEPFTVIVKANLTNVAGAMFTLKYNPALVVLDDGSLTNLSGFEAAGLQMFEVDETNGLITFNAIAPFGAGPITGTNLQLFSADFTALAVGGALFEVDAQTDEFVMSPGYGASTNIYSYTLQPVTVDLIELPTVTSDFGGSYYLVGEERDFTITVTNHNTAYSAPELHLTLPAGLTIEYGGEEYTGSMVVDLADLAINEVVKTDLTATFSQAYASTAASLVVQLYDALTPAELLVDTSFSAFAYKKATVTVSGDPYYIVSDPGAFTVTINNPDNGRNYGNSIVFDIVIANHVVEDVSAISCTMGTQTWVLTDTLYQDGVNVKASIGGVDGYFTIPAPLTATINCSVTYATPGTYSVSGYMVEATPSPERIVSDAFSASAPVYAKPTISSANLTGPFQEGVAQEVTINLDSVSAMYTPNDFVLHLGLPEGTIVVYNGTDYTCTASGCDIPVTLAVGANSLAMMITFDDPLDDPVTVTLVDTVFDPDRTLATFTTSTDVVVYANVAELLGTVRMQGRTTRSGVVFTLTGTLGYGPYTATSTDLLTGNVKFTNLASGVYTITVVQARYLDVTIESNKSIDLAVLQALAALELKAGDANDDNTINSGDAGIVGGQYKQPSPTNGDINFDGTVNIQDLALVGSNYGVSSAQAYSEWMGIAEYIPEP